jgi:FixJ family two-component response regulator
MVFVVENDQSLREGLQSLLCSVGHKVKSFESAEAFLEERVSRQPGCLILDVRLSGISGLQLQKRLIANGDGIPTIFISANGDIPMCAQAMKAGAVDFLPKPFREQEILETVQIALDRELVRHERDREVSKALVNYRSLTRRERDIVKLVVTGQTNKKIADALGVSEVTVKIHRGHVMHKMGAASLADLVRIFDMTEPHLASEAPKSSTN